MGNFADIISIFDDIADAIRAKNEESTLYKPADMAEAIMDLETIPSEIYGVEWNRSSSSALTRTDAAENFSDPSPAVRNGDGSSPFDTILPWSGMTVEDNQNAGKVVKIPKFYYKWTIDNSKIKLQISCGKKSGFKISPLHMDRGDGKGERQYAYVGRYHCADNFKSISGVYPLNGYGYGNQLTRDYCRQNIHTLGSTIWQIDYAAMMTIKMLYLVEYADWNCQEKIGYGCSPSSNLYYMGHTDSMVYHTGTDASSRTSYGATQYRHIEGLWDNVFDFTDGIYFDGTNVYIIKNPSSFSDDTGGVLVGTRITSSGSISNFTVSNTDGYEWVMLPTAVSGGNDTYLCDYYRYVSPSEVLRSGGSNYKSQYYGLFCFLGDYAASDGADAGTGTRLMILP